MMLINFIYDLFVVLVWILSYAIIRVFRYRRNVTYLSKSIYTLKKPVVIVTNHRHPFDAWFVSTSLPFSVYMRLLPIRPFVTMSFKPGTPLNTLKKFGIIQFVYFIYGTVIVPKEGGVEEKLKPLQDKLNEGNSIMFMPEGKLNREKNVSEIRDGIVFLRKNNPGIPFLFCGLNYRRHPVFPFLMWAKLVFDDISLDNPEDYKGFVKEKLEKLYTLAYEDKKNN